MELENLERFPEIERAIIEALEEKGGKSDFSTLENLFPRIETKKFVISLHFLEKEGLIKEGKLANNTTLVTMLDKRGKRKLIGGHSLSREYFLVAKEQI